MAYLEWNSSLVTGVEEIDDDHKVLVGILNEFHDAIVEHRSRSVISGILLRLIDIFTGHFAREERLYTGTGYPQQYQHTKEHEEMMLWAAGYRQRLAEGAPPDVFLESLDSFKVWCADHMREADQDFVHYLPSQAIR